ncbi:hypothetical protein CLHUN_35310 [Ruminiclostridium hungatei]|uniref:Uncharacterized protein n=1 Tax=Ruminiclostridium hungatei TaxID=48256 RepID=A0A1V4SFI5_RUMHU|nr:hypothetical protein [Ruminiclostridium hungatei]OPX42564.1 hypothetical protein CLHUN_35310 [Ruminiclostridium hungatei]
MNKTMGKLIRLLPQKTNDAEYTKINFVPEDTDYIQDHKAFEDRRQQLINEYELQLSQYINNTTMQIM